MKKDWKKLFSPIILARGKEYYEMGAVQDLTVSDEEILARVEGSESYEVEIELRGNTVTNMDCTCPYAEDHDACKHMAAVLYEWESQKEAPALSAETERFVRNLSAEQAKNLLLAHAQTCASLREILFELSEEKKTGKKRSAWKKELAEIRRRYSYDGYIDYRGAYDYFTECVDFLDEKIDPLIEGKHLKEAFTVCCDIYKTATDVDCDDSDGSMGIFANAFLEKTDDILLEADAPLRAFMHAHLWEMCGNDISPENDPPIEEFLLNAFWEPALLEKNREIIDGALARAIDDDHMTLELVRYKISTMRKLGLPENEIAAVLGTYRHLPQIRRDEITVAIQKGDTNLAIALVRESQKIDKEEPYLLKIYAELLIDLYREKNDTEAYRAELESYLFTYEQRGTEYIEQLKALLPPEEWEAMRERLLSSPTIGDTRFELLNEEGLYRRLLSETACERSLWHFRQYEQVLRQHFPEEVRDIWLSYLRTEMHSASTRSMYADLISRLKKLKSYPDGKALTQALADEWKQAYPKRSAMLDELKKAKF